MCLLSVAWQSTAEYPLVFAGNRDEYHARPTAAADWWEDAPDVLGGRDLLAGGSWLGMRRDGRFAVVTNRPDLPAPGQAALSRGDLVSAWLADRAAAPESFSVERLAGQSQRYGGFSLLLGEVRPGATGSLQQFSGGNGVTGMACLTVAAGITGLSNTAINQPWPKLQWLNQEMTRISTGRPDVTTLFDLLQRKTAVPGNHSGGVPATPFVSGSLYVTRSSTVIIVDRTGHCQFVERSFGPAGVARGEAAFEFELTS
jgi:uncharacterized protein with NRDE domain